MGKKTKDQQINQGHWEFDNKTRSNKDKKHQRKLK